MTCSSRIEWSNLQDATPGKCALQPTVAVVGACASGKTTLVRKLRQRGIGAYPVAQEHSRLQYMYRLREPDYVVYLDVSYPVVRCRRDVSWGPERLRQQKYRLRQARRRADTEIDTDSLTADEVCNAVLRFLACRAEEHVSPLDDNEGGWSR